MSEPPSYMTVFVGGFGDFLTGIFHRVFSEYEGTVEGEPFMKAYYHWDGNSWGILHDNFSSIADDIEQYCRIWKGIPVVLIGHSYGGSAAMAIARLLSRKLGDDVRMIVLTIDAVSLFQPSTRAEGVAYWANAYLSEGGDGLDFIYRLAGRWGECSEADDNLPFSGYELNGRGKRHSHRRPGSMAVDQLPGMNGSLMELCVPALEELIRQYRQGV